MKKSSFVEGTLIATLSIFIVKILGMLYVIPFYAMVGVQGSALYAYAYNIYSIFLDISTAGLPIAISKIINEYDTLGKMEAKQRTYEIGKRILLVAAVCIFTILMVFAPQIATILIGDLEGGNTVADVALAIRVISLSILVVPFLSVEKGYLQGHKIINISSISQIIEQIIRIAVILVGCYVALKIFGTSTTTAVCIAVSGAFFGALVAYLYILIKIRKNKKELHIDTKKKDDQITNKEIAKKIVSYAIPFIIIDILSSLYNFTDMVITLRALNYLHLPVNDIEFIATSISTWSIKISMVISSVAMGMTISLIPTIVTAFTLKDFKQVNEKLNQALQMIIMISLPMAVGIALLSTPIWSIFYGLENNYGPMILSIVVFVALVANIFMITSSTLQSLNKFKLVYISAIIGFALNLCLDFPLTILYNKIGIPECLAPSTASIIGYLTSSIFVLYKLKKEHKLTYKKTYLTIFKVCIATLAMAIVVVLLKMIIPVNYDNKISCIINVAIISVIGAIIYIVILSKNKTLQNVLGEDQYKRIMKKITFGKIK